jgi:hypothetical protein
MRFLEEFYAPKKVQKIKITPPQQRVYNIE